MAAVPAGSFLVISHLASDVQQEAMAEMGRRLNQSMTQQFTMRSRGQVTAFFDGLTLLDPGVVLTHQWRPDDAAEAATPGVLWAGRRPQGLNPPDTGVTRTGGPATRGFLRDSGAMTR